MSTDNICFHGESTCTNNFLISPQKQMLYVLIRRLEVPRQAASNEYRQNFMET